jgi:ribosome biogenesis GTPase
MNNELINQLGFSRLSQENVDDNQIELHDIARVITVNKDSYIISKGHGHVFAELSGKYLYGIDSALDFPTVGDWVYSDFYDNNTHAVIHGIIPRFSVLKRKTSGKSIDYQLIAANIDTAFIIQSLDDNFNLRRLERYMVMINESEITPVILLSKCDLLSDDEISEKVKHIEPITTNVLLLPFSNEDATNIDKIEKLMLPESTFCLIGSSGVGKTTLLNHLLGNAALKTGIVRTKDSKGRHTTTRRQLIKLENHAMIIDTPGMREIANLFVDTGMDATFSEIIELADRCKYRNCTHNSEKGCAILAAIHEGSLSEERFRNYLSMKNEVTYNNMSYHEKKQKDRKFQKRVNAASRGKRLKENW